MKKISQIRTELMPVNCWNSGIMMACTAQKAVRWLICAAANISSHTNYKWDMQTGMQTHSLLSKSLHVYPRRSYGQIELALSLLQDAACQVGGS